MSLTTIKEKHHAENPPKKNSIYRLEDPEENEISVNELVQRYLFNPEICFDHS
jgi:hypothetical protein